MVDMIGKVVFFLWSEQASKESRPYNLKLHSTTEERDSTCTYCCAYSVRCSEAIRRSSVGVRRSSMHFNSIPPKFVTALWASSGLTSSHRINVDCDKRFQVKAMAPEQRSRILIEPIAKPWRHWRVKSEKWVPLQYRRGR